MNTDPEEPKLIIDEDYKSQVQREKEEALQRQQTAADAETAESETGNTSPSSGDDLKPTQTEAQTDELPPPPTPSMELLVTTLATQAMSALGQIPDTDGKTLPPNLNYARHFIDMIGMLEEKTKGNLSDDEMRFLGDTLHQLRMMFVEFSKQGPA